MADQPEAGTGEVRLTGFERYPREVLLQIRDNLDVGYATVREHELAGTLHVRRKKGAATPKEAGYTFVMLRDAINAALPKEDQDD